MMPTRVTPAKQRTLLSSKVGWGCILATLLLGSLLVVLSLSSASAPPKQGSQPTERRMLDKIAPPEKPPFLKGPEDKPPNPPLPTKEELKRPACSTLDQAAMAGAAPCEDKGNTMPKAEGSAQVALMFLVKNTIPTEPIWAAFMASAAELTLRRGIPPTAPNPIKLLPPDEPSKEELGTKCWAHGGLFAPFGVPPREKYEGEVPPAVTNVTGWLQENCAADMSPREHYELQDLFNVYVHRMPGAEGSGKDSLFYKRDIEHRIHAEFAQPSLVAASRTLLAAALKDSRNSMFLLVSETCMPLHHPALFYAQLMAESHISRVGSGPYNPQRWFHLMATEHLKGTHFQKGDQWFSLNRMHAELVATDTHVWSQFQRYCRTQMACWQPSRFFGHVCIADEHFVPTLLAAYNLGEQRDDIGVLTFTDWMSSQGSWHPKTFHPGNAVEDIFTMRRRSHTSGCPKLPHNSLRSSASIFQHTPICNSAGDKVMPLAGPNYTPVDPNSQSRQGRRLTSLDDTPVDTDCDQVNPPEWLQGKPITSSQRQLNAEVLGEYSSNVMFKAGKESESSGTLKVEFGDAGVHSDVHTGGSRKLTLMPEFGPERDRLFWDKAQDIRDSMRSNLKQSGWLGGFEPMQMHCPLLGRRIEPQSVSEFAALAWRCDGLGFAWECLHAG